MYTHTHIHMCVYTYLYPCKCVCLCLCVCVCVCIPTPTPTPTPTRQAYDAGNDIKREILRDGSEGPSFWEQVHKAYFPEAFGYEPFGDPYEHKRAHLERKRQETPPQPNAADIPAGSYQDSCQGCSVLDARRLRCTHCANGRGQLLETSILLKQCSDVEWIGNNAGSLACQPKPQHLLPPPAPAADVDAEESVVHGENAQAPPPASTPHREL